MFQKILTQVTTYINKLSENTKKLLVVALVLIIIAMFDLLFIGPTVSRMKTLDEDIKKEQEQIKQNLLFLSYKKSIQKKNSKVDSYFTVKTVSDDEVIASFLKKLEIIASKANVVVAKVTPNPVQQVDEGKKYLAELECSGSFSDVITFFHMINTSDDLMKVTKYTLTSKKSDSDEVKANLSIAKLIITRQDLIKSTKPAESKTPPNGSTTQVN